MTESVSPKSKKVHFDVGENHRSFPRILNVMRFAQLRCIVFHSRNFTMANFVSAGRAEL